MLLFGYTYINLTSPIKHFGSIIKEAAKYVQAVVIAKFLEVIRTE